MACIAACCTITSEVVAAPIQKAAQAAKAIFGGAKMTGKSVKIPAPPKTASPSRGSYSSSGGFNPYPSAAAARQAAEIERRRREEEQRRRSSNPWYY